MGYIIMSTETERKEALAEIEENIKKAKDLLKASTKLADKHGLFFHFSFDGGEGGYTSDKYRDRSYNEETEEEFDSGYTGCYTGWWAGSGY